ncbi:hypothetical protein BZA70DRAFT_283781 [Myxozyma melibiosi]|uniref:Uncharacterized protein n=1 Tax=Myxozyma melibiosi TaxID=54550 RepID=A0ABR1EZP1_9ASCO
MTPNMCDSEEYRLRDSSNYITWLRHVSYLSGLIDGLLEKYLLQGSTAIPTYFAVKDQSTLLALESMAEYSQLVTMLDHYCHMLVMYTTTPEAQRLHVSTLRGEARRDRSAFKLMQKRYGVTEYAEIPPYFNKWFSKVGEHCSYNEPVHFMLHFEKSSFLDLRRSRLLFCSLAAFLRRWSTMCVAITDLNRVCL